MARKVNKPLPFHDFTDRYVSQRSLSKEHGETLKRRARAFEQFVGDAVLVRLLNEWNLNQFLASLSARSTWTVNGYRNDILTLWNAAADEELISYPVVRRIRKAKLSTPMVDCYMIDEVRALLASAEALEMSLARCEPGCLGNGVSLRYYWSAAIRVAWDTGLRRGDIWRLDRSQLRPDGTFKIIQHKTKRAVRRRLRPSTIEAVNRIARGVPLAWPHASTTFSDIFRRIVLRAGVNRGTFKWLRRAAGSYCEAQQPGAGAKALGHQHGSTFYRHYDAQLDADLPMPPELDHATA